MMDLLKEYLYKLSVVKPKRKSRLVLVNQNKNALLVGLFARDKGLIEDMKAYKIDDVPPLAVIDGRVYFISNLSGGELVSFTSCIYESVANTAVDRLVDSIIVVTEEHCLWCIPFIQGACKLSYRDGYIVNVVDFNYKSTIWYDKLGIDEVPALVYKGKLVSTGSPEDPEQAYEYIKKLLKK